EWLKYVYILGEKSPFGPSNNPIVGMTATGLDSYNGVEVFVDLVGDLDINDSKQFKSASNLNIIKNRPKPLKT
ncbi:hypothetical protein IGI04_030611, partial [Brassica rapa subsp. trilocularis]